MNEPGVAIACQDVADRVFARVAKLLDGTGANLKKGISSIESELTKPIEAQASYQISMEIRAHFKSLKLEERVTLLRRAIGGGDHRSATAVLGGPSYLSGLPDEIHAVMTREYHEKHNPDKAKRLKAMKAAYELIGQRSGLLFKELEKAVGMRPDKVKELRERKQNADRMLKSA
jgi:hypothetical protein